MKSFRFLAFAAALGLLLAGTSQSARAQLSISVNIGAQPVCPYGYFNYAPYQCAPFGYYAPEWFHSGVFIGAGPWFAGPVGFRGYYNRAFDPHYGYHGPFPGRGEHADWGRHEGWERNYHGSAYRSEVRHDNGNHYGDHKDHGNPHGEDHGSQHGEDHGNGHSESHDNGHGNDHGNDHGNGHGHDDDHGHGH